MTYRATVIKVMIASPSDVAPVRQMVRDVIHEWNAIHSADRNIVLLPVGWETHSSPSMEERAQAVINKQVLADCDLLVAVFWTRLGSPTGKAASGTVEEIEEHISAGKPVMLYFSDAPVRPDSVDDQQYKALRRFKSECYKRGLVEGYDSLSEFREKFGRQLAQTIIREFGNAVSNNDDSAAEQAVADLLAAARTTSASTVEQLSDSSRILLKEAAQDSNGQILRIRTSHGLSIQTNGKNMVDSREPRVEAKWDGALRELAEFGLVQDRGYKGEVFAVTESGYDAANQLHSDVEHRGTAPAVRILEESEWDESVFYHRINVQNVSNGRTRVSASVAEIDPKPEAKMALPFPLQSTNHIADVPAGQIQPVDLLRYNPRLTQEAMLLVGGGVADVPLTRREYTILIVADGSEGPPDKMNFKIAPHEDGVDVIALPR